MDDSGDECSVGSDSIRPLQSFMGVQHTGNLSSSKAAVLGLPFDCGTHPTRIGARQGPTAIREQSQLVRPYLADRPGPSVVDRLGLVDAGDADVQPGDVIQAHHAIESAMEHLLGRGAAPVTMGGDGAIALPQMRALSRRYDGLAVVHIDAHTDSYDDDGYTTATSFSRAAEEGVVDPAHSAHVGIRGSTYTQDVIRVTQDYGYQVVTMPALFEAGIARTMEQVRERVGSRPTFVCFDMDFFDPSCAPGVCTPTWGGATAREGFQVIRELHGLHIVAVDVNTVSPPHDVGGMTALLAAATMFELICLLAGLRVEA